MMVKKLNWKQAYWFLYLIRFDFVLHYYLSKSIGKPDVLSHQPDHRDESHDNENIVLLKLEFLTTWVMERMVFEGKEQNLLTDYQEKPVARVVRKLWQTYKKSMCSLE